MHLNILSEPQEKQLNLLERFKKEFILVGGTAIALEIGHRKSIDFDLFKEKPFNSNGIKKSFSDQNLNYSLLYEDSESIDLIFESVKWTFFHYPFPISNNLKEYDFFRSPDLLTLAAMKAYALGRRAKWKDYVDLYFLLKDYFTIEEIAHKAEKIFEDAFAEKLFRQQLVYFEGIDYTEPIEWISDSISEDKIQKTLKEFALI